MDQWPCQLSIFIGALMFRGACGSGGHTEDFNGYSHHSVAELKKKKTKYTFEEEKR